MSRQSRFKFTNSEKASFALAIALLIGLCVYTGQGRSRESHDDSVWQAHADSITAIVKAEQAHADSTKAKSQHKKRSHKKSKKTHVAAKATPRNYLDEVVSN
jgi:uncharacterized membrane protein YraQ (UPF0718 family)